jgi:hypothetical protein
MLRLTSFQRMALLFSALLLSIPVFAQDMTLAMSDKTRASKAKPLVKEEKPLIAAGDDTTATAVAAPQQAAQGAEGDALRKAVSRAKMTARLSIRWSCSTSSTTT